MKKTIAFAAIFSLFTTFSFAQKASESNETFSKGVTGSAITITCEGQAKNVETVMKKKFKEAKGKNTSTKGWSGVTGAVWSELSPKTLDYFFKVEKAGNDQSTIKVMISHGNDNFISSKEDAQAMNNCKTMLEGMVSEIRLYELGLAIAAQEKVVEGAEKDLEKLVKEGEDLVKDQGKLEEELAENKKDQETNKGDQEAQKKEIETQKKLLQELQAKMK